MGKLSYSNVLVLILIAGVFLVACSCDSAEEAREELRNIGVEFTKDAFIKQIVDGNTYSVILFLKSGMDANAEFSDWLTSIQMPVIFLAVTKGNIQIVESLIKYGADVNSTYSVSPFLESPLTIAIKKGYIDIVRLLISSGSDLTIKNDNDVAIVDDAILHARKWVELDGHPDLARVQIIEQFIQNAHNSN